MLQKCLTTTIANVENRIYEAVQEVIKDKKLKNLDVIQIVQIFDIDRKSVV